MKVEIVIQDRRAAEEAEALGIEVAPVFEYTDFYFRSRLVESFWVDKKDMEIVFSIGGSDYRTPYTDEKFEEFRLLV